MRIFIYLNKKKIFPPLHKFLIPVLKDQSDEILKFQQQVIMYIKFHLIWS